MNLPGKTLPGISEAEGRFDSAVRPDAANGDDRPHAAIELRAANIPHNEAGWLRLTAGLQSLAATCAHLSVTVPGNREALLPRIQEVLAGTGANWCISTGPIEGVDVLPRSPLLAPEQGRCAWSGLALAVPAETAWFFRTVDLLAYVTSSGRLDRDALGESLDDCIDAAEQHFDTACWPTAAMQLDAWMNRRVAVLPTGLVALHVQHHFTLSMLHQLTGWIGARLQARSGRHALTRQTLPAIRSADPSRGMPAGALRDEWRDRWRRAVSTTRVHNRNVLALCSALLCFKDEHSGHLDVELLSLLQHADTLSVSPPGELSLADGRRFRERLRAALQQRHALDQIAKHI